jgi:hypothetical protein
VLPEAPPDAPEMRPVPEEVRPSIEGALDLTKIRKAGRPKGSPDRFSRRERKFLKMSFWFGELKRDWKQLRPIERARLCFDFIHLLVDKSGKLPQNPNDSKKSAKEIMDALRELEGSTPVQSDNCGEFNAFQHNTIQNIPLLRNVKPESTLNPIITQTDSIVNPGKENV